MGTPTTPGVYIQEIDGFSSSVVAVQTAVPVFIGYTEYAQNGSQSLTNVPMPISSMAEFQMYFADPKAGTGGAPQPQYTYVTNTSATPPYTAPAASPRFNLYYGMMMFFNNGGGNCYILSIGSYANAIANPPSQTDYAAAFPALEQFAEPTMVVMPDAILLDAADWVSVSQQALTHCATMQSRIAIFDILNGYNAPNGTSTDPIQGADGESGFYAINGLGEDFNKYGVAYYPWINTNIVTKNMVDFTWFTADSLPQLQTDLLAEASSLFTDASKLNTYNGILANVQPGMDAKTVQSTHSTLQNVSPTYQQALVNVLASANLLAPASAMAGVYTRNDNTYGVFQSPANTTIINAVSPSVILSDSQQGNLNVPLNGLAVNAIRTFPNFGLLVWGARTMAGNSDDWRYINVRRTMIMLEQSIKYAMQAYVFQANDSVTWVAVQSTISNFLNLQWKQGALVGAKPADAYSVAVGLNQTMTTQDILDGVMNVMVQVSVVRPAEFIVLTFQQQMLSA